MFRIMYYINQSNLEMQLCITYAHHTQEHKHEFSLFKSFPIFIYSLKKTRTSYFKGVTIWLHKTRVQRLVSIQEQLTHVLKFGIMVALRLQQMSRTILSYFTYTKNEGLIGDAAKNKLISMNHINTVSDVKRWIGRKFSDAFVRNAMKLWPFNV